MMKIPIVNQSLALQPGAGRFLGFDIGAETVKLVEREGVLNLTLAFNGDPINTTALDNFAFEVRERFKTRKTPAHIDLNLPRTEQPFSTSDRSTRKSCPSSDAAELIPADEAWKEAVLRTREI